jgi:branched-chain amino acid transport system ATP-binding protein
MKPAPLLTVSGLGAAYGGIPALADIALTVAPGQVVTVIGPNGAGKTTLVNAVMGVLPATGSTTFEGQDLGNTPIEQRVAAGISLVAEKRELFATMTVADNLRLGGFRLRARGRAANAAAQDRIYDLFPRLRDRSRQLAGTLSGGERQMLAMGRALMAEPRLLMLDEPSLGLAPLVVRDIFRTIVDLRTAGVSILLIEQNARAALQIADVAYVLESGRISPAADPATLAADPRIVDMYLGQA